MSGFTALNLEPEDIVEEEIDDTREIQIEEALKLYQTALKLHSQGPVYYSAASDAYNDLFQSEVFKYPEVASDYSEEQVYEVLPAGELPVEQESIPLSLGNAADSAANSLPQLIYLAYKNRAQFVLDLAHHELQRVPANRRELCQYYYAFCRQSLQDSASALERDDSDLDLWKKAARISDVLVSQRLARFCLESVLAGDDEGGDQAIDLSGLDEAYASGELEQVLKLVGDDLSCVGEETVRPKLMLLKMLQKSNDAYPYLPKRSEVIDYLDDRRKPNSFSSNHIELSPSTSSRSSLGEAMLEALSTYTTGEQHTRIGPFIKLVIPNVVGSLEDAPDMLDKAPPENTSWESTITHNTIADTPRGSTDGSPKSHASFHSAPDIIEPDVEEIMHTEPPTLDKTTAVSSSGPKADTPSGKEPSHAQEEPRMPTRKRSSTAAGIEEHESRTKSKRLRARESMLELAAQDEDPAQEVSQYNGELLAILEDADERSFGYVNKLVNSIGMHRLAPLSTIRSAFWQEGDMAQDEVSSTIGRSLGIALADMRGALTSWTDEKGSAVMSGHGKLDILEKSSGLALFSRHLRADQQTHMDTDIPVTEDHALSLLSQRLGEGPVTIFDAVFMWLTSLTTTSGDLAGSTSSYVAEQWTDVLKHCVRRLSVDADEQIYYTAQQLTSRFDTVSPGSKHHLSDSQVLEFIQTMFEIHLDIYSSYMTPGGQVEEASQVEQLDRLYRWAQLSTECMQAHYASEPDIQPVSALVLRFVWASTKVASYTSGDDKSHLLLCLEDLHALLVKAVPGVITLPNSTVMPQISIAAVEQEISRLNTLDFFMSVFDTEISDPITIIMKLEPILEDITPTSTSDAITHTSAETLPTSSNQNEQLREFLDSGDASLKLFLWRKLQNAYTAISYSPKVISCLLRSFEIIAHELQTERHASLSPNERQIAMLQSLHDADNLVAKVLNKVTDDSTAFESLDEQHIASSVEAVVTTLTILHGFVLFDDSIRVGQTPLPSLRSSSLKIFDKSRDRFRDAYVRLWTLLFYLMKEATTQKSECFTQPAEELAEYLRNVHQAFGYRQYCKHCNKMFVKLAKNELLALRSETDYSGDLAQILYDMYQIKFGVGLGDADHGCVPDLLRDKTTAMSLVPIIMAYATRLNIRDLIKSDLKGTIDKIQQCLGPVRSSSAISFNKKIISNFLKSQINPQEVYRSLNGLGDLTTKSVHGDHAKVAALGWYLLLGKINLAKFKSIKRVNPTATDDLDIAATFLRHDLEHNIMNWESWYRLAQVYDAKIEDSLIWNAAKLNDSRADIATLERNAINAYTMAVAMAMRVADDASDTVQNISDMFSEFASRLYASSRPPLNMVAFQTDQNVRHISNSHDQTMSKAPLIHPFRPYSIWSFASHLLRRKFKTNAREWFCQYTLGKCLWKMFQSEDNIKARKPISMEDVLEAFTEAIALVPKKEKSTDYIIEPHYKLVSIVHKLVYRKLLDARRGIEYLRGTQLARGARLSENEQGEIEWEPYILDVLLRVGRADKSNWHHRITARAAHIIYDDDPNLAGALGAKYQFTQQIFTKTMAMQVWKPEFERPGRHYVYTGQYLSFFVHLLEQLNDREGMEQLVRRIRRKTSDFLDHPKIWEQTATTYLRLLRRTAKIPEGSERAIFDKIGYEEFAKMSEKVEQWAHKQDSSSIYLSTISDAIELKKLNNSLMKGPAIDDLIGDTYACMYEAATSQLSAEEPAPQTNRPVLPSYFVSSMIDLTSTGEHNLDRMRLNNLLSAQVDSTVATTPGERPGGDARSQVSGHATPPVELARMPTPTKPGRPKTITKREVQRKAEAAISKLQIIKTPSVGKKLVIDIPSIKRPRAFSNNGPIPDEEGISEPKEEDDADGASISRRPSLDSNRSSEHPVGEDDNENEADDESELSEIGDNNEDESRGESLLPGLMNRKPEVEGDADADDEEGDEAGSNGDEEDNDGQEDENHEDVEEGEEGEEGEEEEVDGSDDEPEAYENMDVDVDVDDNKDDGMEIQSSQNQEQNAESKLGESDVE